MSKNNLISRCGAGSCLLLCAATALGQAKPEAPKDKAGVAATIGGEPVTLQELDAKALKTNMKLAQSLYDARKAALDQLVLERLLGTDAKAKGVTVDKLLADKVAEKNKPVTDADVETYFNANKARMGNRTLEQVSPQIRSSIVAQREGEAKTAILNELKAKTEVKVMRDVPRVEVAIAPNDPTKGPAGAKVTIVEYSDFQ